MHWAWEWPPTHTGCHCFLPIQDVRHGVKRFGWEGCNPPLTVFSVHSCCTSFYSLHITRVLHRRVRVDPCRIEHRRQGHKPSPPRQPWVYMEIPLLYLSMDVHHHCSIKRTKNSHAYATIIVPVMHHWGVALDYCLHPHIVICQSIGHCRADGVSCWLTARVIIGNGWSRWNSGINGRSRGINRSGRGGKGARGCGRGGRNRSIGRNRNDRRQQSEQEQQWYAAHLTSQQVSSLAVPLSSARRIPSAR